MLANTAGGICLQKSELQTPSKQTYAICTGTKRHQTSCSGDKCSQLSFLESRPDSYILGVVKTSEVMPARDPFTASSARLRSRRAWSRKPEVREAALPEPQPGRLANPGALLPQPPVHPCSLLLGRTGRNIRQRDANGRLFRQAPPARARFWSRTRPYNTTAIRKGTASILRASLSKPTACIS